MKIFLRILVNTLIGVALIIIWLKFVDLEQIVKVLASVDLRYLGAYFGFFVFSGLIRSARLKILLNKYNLTYKNLIFLNFLSQLLSFLIPLRVGEITKSVYFTTKLNISLSKSIIWIFIDRFLDFWVDLVLIGILLYFVPSKLPYNFEQIIILILVVFSVIPVLMIKSSRFSKKFFSFASRFMVWPKLKSWFVSTTHSVIDGFEILHRHPLELLLLIGLTIVASISDSMYWLIVLTALGVKIEFINNLLGSLLAALTYLVPSAPGYIGSAEAAGLAVFGGILGLDPNLASAASLLSHVLTTLALLIAGVASLYFLKFNLNLVWEKLTKRN